MKNKFVIFLRRYGLSLFGSLLLPVVILAFAYFSIGIYPGSARSLLASDSFTQYANFHAAFHNLLHGEQSVFYTWSGSLGLNNWAFMAYYLNGLFTFFVYFFDNSRMPDTLYFLTLLKFGMMGVSFWIFAFHTFKKLGRVFWPIMSTAYALMAFSVAYSEVIMWLDALIYLPLIVLGIHRLMDQDKPMLLFYTYLLLFLSNFYMAFMVGIFTVLYFFARYMSLGLRQKKIIGYYFLTSFLAGGASMIVILPTVLDLSNNGEAVNRVQRLFTSDTGAWDFVAKSMAGVYDTSQYKSAPFIYVGLFFLVGCLSYFLSRQIDRKSKWIYGCFLLFFVFSVYIEPLNLAWHGFHAPNMFLFRFSFLFSFLVLVLAGYGLESYAAKDRERLLYGIFLVALSMILVVIFSNKKRYDYLTTASFLVTIVALFCYALFFLAYRTEKWRPWYRWLLFLVTFLEVGFNTQQLLAGISVDWGYPSRSLYTAPYASIDALVTQTEQANTAFYRMENLDPVSTNDSFNYGYHGVSMFSSIRNRHSSAYLNNLGFRSLGTNLIIQYPNNTILMDALFGIKYNLSKQPLQKFGFTAGAKQGAYQLFENQYALPLGILTDQRIYQDTGFKNQTELFNALSGEQLSYFTFQTPKVIRTENMLIKEDGEDVHYAEEQSMKERSITFEVQVPQRSQAYLSLYTDHFSARKATAVVKVGNVKRESNLVDNGQYYNLGYYETAQTIPVTVTFRGMSTVKIAKPSVAILDTEQFEQAVQKMQQKGVDLKVSGHRATATVTSQADDQVLFTTIPFDKGWQVFIDGKKVAIPLFDEAFLTVPLPKGTHEVTFVFYPQGFKIGAALFVGCLLSMHGWQRWLKKKKQEA